MAPPGSRPLGLYLHIPFCKQKCIYCDFYSLPRQEARMDGYVAALQSRLASHRPEGYAADTVYFGGGTPSYLGADRLCAILHTVFQTVSVLPEAEITLEANPDSAGDPAALARLREAGFNRISLGMQSAGDGELKALGRIHTMAQTRAAVKAARSAGFDNLSLDLIYGLPGQTLPQWLHSLEAALSLSPEHLSCYGLKAEEGTPLYPLRHSLPEDAVQADMYLEAAALLERRGYRQYEISNFALPGRASRHNLKYWTLGEYLGFGPGAHSDFGGVRFACSRDLERFLAGDAVLEEVQAMTARDREEEWLLLGLRTVQGLDAGEYQRRFLHPFAPFLPFLHACEQAGYALHEGDRWHLTPRGFLVSNRIIGELLALLPPETGGGRKE